MDIEGSIAFVTGANRGLGAAFVDVLLERGASKVYASARRPETLDLARFRPGSVVPVRLDVTDPGQVSAAAAIAADTTLVVNNAGVATLQNLVGGDLDGARQEMDTHYFGTLSVIRAFAPHLAGNGGGGVVNILSAASWVALPVAGAYSASKAAAWGLTEAVRLELAAQGTLVTAVHVGAVDTDMMAAYDVPKTSPHVVAGRVLDGVAAGRFEVLVDEEATHRKRNLTATPEERYADLLGR